MSASNWTVCPDCVKRAHDIKEAFETQYYGKLDSFVYGKILEEINTAVEYMESYSSDEHIPNKEILELMEEKNVEVKLYNTSYGPHEMLFSKKVSCCLREDYNSGVTDEGYMQVEYGCSCDCGYGKSMFFDESKHKIIKKEEGEDKCI